MIPDTLGEFARHVHRSGGTSWIGWTGLLGPATVMWKLIEGFIAKRDAERQAREDAKDQELFRAQIDARIDKCLEECAYLKGKTNGRGRE